MERDGEGSVVRRKEGDFPETLETIFITKEGDENLRGKTIMYLAAVYGKVMRGLFLFIFNQKS